MAQFMRVYNSWLQKRPYTTQIATATTLFGFGDVMAQQVFERKGTKHDFGRTARLVMYGGFFFAPIMHNWYKNLAKVKFGSERTSLFARVFLDQIVLAPTGAAVFYTSMTLMEGYRSKEAVKERLREKWWPTLYRSWFVYIPVQFLNFTIMPPLMHLPVLSVVSLFWNAYLSYMNANDQNPKKEKREQVKNE